MIDVGALLRAERAIRRLNQSDMAARLGITRQLLAMLEAGADGVSAGTVLRVLADLGVVIVAHSAGVDAGSAESPPSP